MLGIVNKSPAFKITGIKPGFNEIEAKGASAVGELCDCSGPIGGEVLKPAS